MTKRNLWGYEETLTLISIIDEKDCLQKIEDKKYKLSEIYQMVEQEMFARGYYDKNAKQMEFRWQNLKKNFYKDRKMIESGNKSHKISPYFDHMEVMLSNRRKANIRMNLAKKEPDGMCSLSVNPIENGNNTSSEEEEHEIEEDIELDMPKTEMPAFEECFPALPASKPRIHLKRIHEPEPPSKVDMFQEKIKKVTKELNEDLFKKQKELIEYEFRMFANYTAGRDEKFKEMMSTNTHTFLCGIKDLLQDGNINTHLNTNMKIKSSSLLKMRNAEARQAEIEDHNIKQFFQSWDQDSGSKKH